MVKKSSSARTCHHLQSLAWKQKPPKSTTSARWSPLSTVCKLASQSSGLLGAAAWKSFPASPSVEFSHQSPAPPHPASRQSSTSLHNSFSDSNLKRVSQVKWQPIVMQVNSLLHLHFLADRQFSLSWNPCIIDCLSLLRTLVVPGKNRAQQPGFAPTLTSKTITETLKVRGH